MRVVVAMSGGVDSSVAAGLLHEQGHEVIGVTLQLYDHGAAIGPQGRVLRRPGHPRCAPGRRPVWAFAHYVIDAEERFARAVIADFADSYAAGETPVPCIRCNQIGEIRRSDGAGGRSGCGTAGDRALRAARRWAGRGRVASRRRPRSAIRVGFCSPRRGRNWNDAGFRWAPCRTSARCAPTRRAWAWRSRKSPIVRIFASCRRGPMPRSSGGCGRMRWSRARS